MIVIVVGRWRGHYVYVEVQSAVASVFVCVCDEIECGFERLREAGR